MLSRSEQAVLNLDLARALRAQGRTYREIRSQLGLTYAQLSHIRRALRRAKAAGTRLRGANPDATDRDLPVAQSTLPSGLRKRLTASGYRTLGDLADRLADPAFPGLETLPGIGAHRARLVEDLLRHFNLFAGPDDLQAEVERLFPELRDSPPSRRADE